MASLAPTSIHSNGMVVATGLPPLHTGHQQNLPGGLINGAAAKTAGTIAAQSKHAVAAGVTQRGAHRKRGGGTTITVPEVAEGGTIPGVSFGANHAALIGGLNQLKTSATYDGLVGAQPYKIGAGRSRRRKIPDLREPREELAVSAGGKRRRKTKRHGRNRSRHSVRNHVKRRNRSHRRTRNARR